MTGFARLHALLVDDDPLAQVCQDLPESACREQPRNYGVHVVSLGLTKVGEGLADPKLVLAWLLDAIGTPTWALGLLVPVRESLAMLPQLAISARIRRLAVRKTVYVTGCVVQGAAIIGFGLLGWWAQMFTGSVAGMVVLGGVCWLLAAFIFGSISEEPGATEGAIDGLTAVIAQIGLLRSDARLRRLIVTRALLLSTALAPPFYIALSGDSSASGLGTLGPFMVASAAASLASSYVWGRLADRSSRRVLMVAATLVALANAVAAFVALAMPNLLETALLLPALLFVLMIAHQGVRLGRSVHVVGIADRDNRATYTALSNSVVGLILLAGGVFGFIAQWLGIGPVLAIFTLMAALAIWAAAGLDDVQGL